MEVVISTEKLVPTYKTRRRHIPETIIKKYQDKSIILLVILYGCEMWPFGTLKEENRPKLYYKCLNRRYSWKYLDLQG